MTASNLRYNASEPDSVVCRPAGDPIDSLVKHCIHEYPDIKSTEYKDCMKIASPKEFMIFKNAKRNWVKTLERNYDLLRAVEGANKDPDPAGSFRKLCSGRSCIGDFCQWHNEDGKQVPLDPPDGPNYILLNIGSIIKIQPPTCSCFNRVSIGTKRGYQLGNKCCACRLPTGRSARWTTWRRPSWSPKVRR